MKPRLRDVMIAVIAAALGGAGVLAATSAGSPIAPSDKAAIERIVRDYILANPEILPQAMDRLQAREMASAVKANRRAIETPFRGAWEGAADGDVTLVQFFDYACGYCRASLPDIERLVASDKRLKIVYRELPVLGQDSVEAARLALAASGTPARYRQAHRALYAGRPDDAARARIARTLALPANVMADKAIDAELAANQSLQNSLRITGTPTWVVGDTVLSGAVGHDALKAAIAEARARKS